MLLLPSLALLKVSKYLFVLDLFFTCKGVFAYMYVCVLCAYCAPRAQKRVSDTPDLELQANEQYPKWALKT